MSKYIDVEKLKAEIEKLRSGSCISESDDYYEYAKDEIIDIIDSLQQEQPEVDLEKELVIYHNGHFSPCENGVLFSERTGTELDYYDYEDIARHFAEWGAIHLNTRKEE